MNVPIRIALIGFVALALDVSTAMGQDGDLGQALRSFDTDLRLPESDGGRIVRGDFNADGGEDVAAIVEGPRRASLVIFHATRSGFSAHPLYTNLPGGSAELRVVDPGRHPVVGPQGTITLSAPAVELVFPGRSSAMYVWRGDRYHVYGTENYD